jgi:hypothetical protein
MPLLVVLLAELIKRLVKVASFPAFKMIDIPAIPLVPVR